MIEIQIKVNNVDEAINIVRRADKLKNDADFTNGRVLVDAKSLMGVLAADFSKPCKIIVLNDTVTSDINDFVESIKENIISMEAK